LGSWCRCFLRIDVQTFDAALEKLFNDVNAKVFSEAFVPQRQGSAENYSVTVPDVMIIDSSAVLLHTTYIEGMIMDTEWKRGLLEQIGAQFSSAGSNGGDSFT